jgi:hypothetical protein
MPRRPDPRDRFTLHCACQADRGFKKLQDAREVMNGHKHLNPTHHVWISDRKRPNVAVLVAR